MAIFREGTNKLWGAFVGIFVLTALGLDVYWLFSETGPVRWLALLQAKLMGGRWFPKLTFLILLLAELVPVIVLKLLIERITGKPLSPPPQPQPSQPRPQ
ncbi:MAG TPA: hypothetical protein VNM14_24755 [Planctomycetota bacterium]|nr:hypothetical protein [Planctomycetota bacterium]